MYFSSQNKLSLQCGVHSLNNILGKDRFTAADLDQICQQLSDDCINPHRYCCGGDFDANVLMIALQQEKLECKWHDNRQKFNFYSSEISDQVSLKQDQPKHEMISQTQPPIIGYLVNIQVKGFFAWLGKLCCLSSRHWLIVKKYENIYYILDSGKTQPIRLGSSKKAEEWIQQQQENNAEILRVVPMRQT